MEIKNKQSRIWLCILYTDNQKHLNAIDYIRNSPGSILMKHLAQYNDQQNEIKKEHYHCIRKFDNPKWLFTYVHECGLDEEDYHLFKTLSDFKKKFKTLKDYCIYLTHINEPDKETYSKLDFEGSDRTSAINYLEGLGQSNYEMFTDLMNFLLDFMNSNHQSHIYTLSQFYELLCDQGYGLALYKNWNKVRDVIKEWITYY